MRLARLGMVFKPPLVYITFFIQITSPITLKIHGFYQTIEAKVLFSYGCYQECEIADYVIIPKSIVVKRTL